MHGHQRSRASNGGCAHVREHSALNDVVINKRIQEEMTPLFRLNRSNSE